MPKREPPADPDDPSAVFGALVRKARERSGLSQAVLAERIDSTQAYISRLENGKENPPIWTMEALAAALDCLFVFDLVPLVYRGKV